MMEDKRGTKHSRSPSKEGSSSPSGSSTPSSVLFGSPPPLGSMLEIFSRHPYSLVFEQGGPSEKVPVTDLSSSSDEDGFIPDTSRDEEFARKLFGDLIRDVLRLPGNDNVIILSNSGEEDAIDTKAAPSSATRSPAPTASTDDADVINRVTPLIGW
jgi:hypothetical protein